MKPSLITAAARKALIAADSMYHAWPKEQQEHFRANMDEAARLRVRTVLLREIKDIDCTPENVDAFWDELPIDELNELNWANLLTQGIGEDWVFLNESLAENTSLLSFKTLYDYDFDNHLFQETANREQCSDYQARDYYALRFMCWARLIINERLYYANLYSLADYITSHLDEQSSDELQALIPHNYRSGKLHGVETEGGDFHWDMQLDAKGKERQLRELQKRWYQYLQQRWISLSQELLNQPAAAYYLDTSERGEFNCDFIFNNKTALQQIRWRHLVEDCTLIQANADDVISLKKQEWLIAKQWLNDNYQDIMQNFDPNVIPLQPKRKILLAPNVLDSLF